MTLFVPNLMRNSKNLQNSLLNNNLISSKSNLNTNTMQEEDLLKI